MTAATLITLLHTNLAISGVIVDKRSEFISTAFVTGSSNIVVREFLWRASWTPNVVVRELLWRVSGPTVANPDVMELVTILFV